MGWLHKDYELCPVCECMRDTRAGHLCPGADGEDEDMDRPDGQPEDVDAARERVRERIEKLNDPFLGGAVDVDEEEDW